MNEVVIGYILSAPFLLGALFIGVGIYIGRKKKLV